MPIERKRIKKVLIANRGEIAVRVIRACTDASIESVAVYADPDRDSLHVHLASEAYALEGATAAQTYLVADKILGIALRAGADAIHPGYGFLSENAEFAQAVIDAGLTWIGPSPEAIMELGDKVRARHLAQRVGAPLVPGTPDPVKDAQEVLDFADQHGLPVAIKAAFGGGGRGLKVARTREEIPELYESAVREAVTAFGRGECFVERFLERPRHVETQCLADAYGAVAVISTRDCSLQRRHQKLVEEAPAPFLTDEQNRQLLSASQNLLREAGYVGAGTCEFLVGQDGTISFLEVNTRLQVEHPVTEEITAIDLVREQLRLAQGEELGYENPPHLGHAIELRVNGENPAASFMPNQGTITELEWPSGPGIRVESGVRCGDTLGGAFDSMLAKIIVRGATRRQALERARRAVAETSIKGISTVMPFHGAVLNHPDFTADDGEFKIHTTWIENDFAPELEKLAPAPAPETSPEPELERVVVEVGGKRLEVVLPSGLGVANTLAKKRRAKRAPASRAGKTGGDENAVVAPMQGTIVTVEVEEGQAIEAGQTIAVLEAMKMEQPLTSPRAGIVKNLSAPVGETVAAGTVLCELEAQ